jgi:hypothetical protein
MKHPAPRHDDLGAAPGAAHAHARAADTQRTWREALLDPTVALPAGLRTWNGSDPAVRFGVYRNNVLSSLTGVLAAGFPVVQALVGAGCFAALARAHVRRCPPSSPVMSEYGDGFDATIAAVPSLAGVPGLAGVARLERARVRALHAADVEPLGPQALAAALRDPAALATRTLVLHPSLAVLREAQAVVSIWAAHQHDAPAARDAQLARLDPHRSEACAVLRAGDAVCVLPLAPADADLLADLAAGRAFGDVAEAHAQADLPAVLALLMRHHAWCGLAARADAPRSPRSPRPTGSP